MTMSVNGLTISDMEKAITVNVNKTPNNWYHPHEFFIELS